MAILGGMGATVAIWVGWELSLPRRVLRALGR
jgi:hypothetical protein